MTFQRKSETFFGHMIDWQKIANTVRLLGSLSCCCWVLHCSFPWCTYSKNDPSWQGRKICWWLCLSQKPFASLCQSSLLGGRQQQSKRALIDEMTIWLRPKINWSSASCITMGWSDIYPIHFFRVDLNCMSYCCKFCWWWSVVGFFTVHFLKADITHSMSCNLGVASSSSSQQSWLMTQWTKLSVCSPFRK